MNVLMIYPDPLNSESIDYIASSGRFMNLAQICELSGFSVTIATYTEATRSHMEEYQGFPTLFIAPQTYGSKIDEYRNSGKHFLNEVKRKSTCLTSL